MNLSQLQPFVGVGLQEGNPRQRPNKILSKVPLPSFHWASFGHFLHCWSGFLYPLPHFKLVLPFEDIILSKSSRGRHCSVDGAQAFSVSSKIIPNTKDLLYSNTNVVNSSFSTVEPECLSVNTVSDSSWLCNPGQVTSPPWTLESHSLKNVDNNSTHIVVAED